MHNSRLKSDWRCKLCGRSEIEIGHHPLPIRQKAHLIPNRLSGWKPRYGGVKNAFSEAEWKEFLETYKKQFGVADAKSFQEVKTIVSEMTTDLCGECHEEVISEPIYLPEVLDKLRPHFQGKSRVQKIILMTEVLRLGADSLKRIHGQ